LFQGWKTESGQERVLANGRFGGAAFWHFTGRNLELDKTQGLRRRIAAVQSTQFIGMHYPAHHASVSGAGVFLSKL
jgi:hypothetical protein